MIGQQATGRCGDGAGSCKGLGARGRGPESTVGSYHQDWLSLEDWETFLFVLCLLIFFLPDVVLL